MKGMTPLQEVEVVAVLLVVGYVCVRQTGQWSFVNRLVIVWSRLVALVVVLVLVGVLLVPQLAGIRRLAVASSLMLSRVMPVLPAQGAVPARAVPLRVAPAQAASVVGAPELSVAYMDAVLARYGSPAAGTGWALYQDSQEYRIDDAYALGFFYVESHFGTEGEAVITHSLGNLRCIEGAACIDQDRGGYAAFPDWPSGERAWYQLLAGPLYVGSGLVTVPAIVARYAPSSDQNNEGTYAAVVLAVVAALRAGRLTLP